jgi:hypothetical protein
MNHIELQCHIACADWLRFYKNKTKKIWYTSPQAGGTNSAKQGAKLKRMGAVAGVPDFVIGSAISFLLVELKTTDGILSDAQKEFRLHVELLGYRVDMIITDDPQEAVKKMQALVFANV